MRNLKFYSCLFFLVFFLGDLSVRANIGKKISVEVDLIFGPHKGFSDPFLSGKEELKAAVFAPTITQQPTDKSTCAGETVVFTVEAQGSGLSYQWWANTGWGWFQLGEYEYYSGTSTKNLVVDDFNFSSAQPGYPLYRVVVTDASGSVTSNEVALTAISGTAPTISTQPANKNICAGASTSFQVNSSGSVYQWQVSTNGGTSFSNLSNDSIYSNANTNTLNISNTPLTLEGNLYRVIVGSSCTTISSSATLSIFSEGPTFSSQPQNQTVDIGANVIFEAAVTGTTYQWQGNVSGSWANLNDNSLYSGTATRILSVNNVQLSQDGSKFRLIATNSSGCNSISNEAILTVIGVTGCEIAITASNNGPVCPGGNLNLTASSIVGATYSWTGPNGFSSSEQNPILSNITTAMFGTYSVVAIVSGCSSDPAVTTVEPAGNEPIDESTSGIDKWFGHVYDDINFVNYIGNYIEQEQFDQNFGGEYVDFQFQTGNCVESSVYADSFSVKYKMTSTKKGLYLVTIGSDDIARLSNNGELIYNHWDVGHAYEVDTNVLINLTGDSNLVLDYAENHGGNQISFSMSEPILQNTLSQNIVQSIAVGGSGQAISGDDYNPLPQGISTSGYQWVYSTSPEGERIAIPGATGATFIPSSTSEIFTTEGVYYLYRTISLTSANNRLTTPYTVSIESNEAILTVGSGIPITKQPSNQNVCVGHSASFSVEAIGEALSYQWERNTGSGWVTIADGGGIYGGSTSPNLTVMNTDLIMDNYQFRVVVTDGLDESTSGIATLQVIENLGTFTQTGSDKTICPGASTFFEIVTTETYNYQWQVSTDGGISYSNLSNSTNYSNVTTKKLNIINTPGSFHNNLYRLAVTQGGCTGYSNALKLSLPTRITSQPTSQSTSSGGTIVFSAAVTGTNLSYQWQTKDPGTAWWEAGSNSTSLYLYNVQDWMEQQRTYRLRIIDNNNGCTLYSNEVFLYVDEPLANNTISENQLYCGATNAATLTGTNVTGGTSSTYTYLWESSTTSASSGFTSAPGTNNSITYNPGILSQTTWFRRTVSSGTATLTSNSVQITINTTNTWTGSTSTDWNAALNWSCNSLPTLGTDVLIPSGLTNYPILSSGSDGLAKDITLEANASVEVNANQLQIAGTLTNSGTLNVENGSMAFVGNTAQVIPLGAFVNNRIQNLIISNAVGVTSEAIIQLTGILKVENGNFETGNQLTLISDEVRTALIDGSGNGEVTGLVDMQRFMDVAFGYKYFSSPVQTATVGDFSPYVNLSAAFPNFYRYDENREITTPIADTLSTHASGWEAYTTSTSTLNIMEGYAINFGSTTDSVTVELTGEVNNGTLSKTLTNHDKEYTKGFHLVGNPYPSPIDWDATNGWTKTNIDDAIYFFTAGSTNRYTGTYTSYVGGIASDGKSSNIVPSMQGFFVHVSNSTTDTYPVDALLKMTNAVRTNNFSQQFLKKPEAKRHPLIRITAGFENKEVHDPVVLYFDPYSSLGFEKQKDAHKLMNTDENVPNLFTLTPDGDRLAINALRKPKENDRIPLGIKTEKAGTVILRLKDIENISSGYLYLVDMEKRIAQDLNANPEYQFTARKGDENSRFYLTFSPTRITNPAIVFDEPFSVQSGKGPVYIKMNLPAGKTGHIRISTVSGQILKILEVGGQETVEIREIRSDGVYFINLLSEGRTFSKKVLVKE